MAERQVEVGCVRSIHPARRQVRVTPGPGGAGQLEGRTWVHVALPDATRLRCRVASVRTGSHTVILELSPGVPRECIGRMKGARIFLDAEDVRPGSEGTWDAGAWIGWIVIDQTGRSLGEIAAAYPTAAHDVIEIVRPCGGRMRLPVIEAVVEAADAERGCLVVRDIAPYVVEDED